MNRTKSLQNFLLLIAAAVSFLFFYAPAQAEVNTDSSIQALTLSPFIFDEKIGKGQSATENIILTNTSSSPLNLTVEVSDFIPDQDGGRPIFDPNHSNSNPRYSLSSWIKIDKAPTTLNGGSKVSIPITINVPIDTEDGSHYGGVLFTYSTPGESGSVSVVKKAATLFFVQTGVANPSLLITHFASEKRLILANNVNFVTELTNTGNVHLSPKGNIQITNIFGSLVAAVPVNRDSNIVLPGTNRTFLSNWSEGFHFGPYHLNEVIYYNAPGGQNFEIRSSNIIWFFPVKMFIISIIALLILFCFGKLALKKYKNYVIKSAERE